MNTPNEQTYKLTSNAIISRCKCNLFNCLDKHLKLGNIVQCTSEFTYVGRRQSTVSQCHYTGSEMCLIAAKEDLSSWACSLCLSEQRDDAEDDQRFEANEKAEEALAHAIRINTAARARRTAGITFYTYLYIYVYVKIKEKTIKEMYIYTHIYTYVHIYICEYMYTYSYIIIYILKHVYSFL
jgi:hypothetical protein